MERGGCGQGSRQQEDPLEADIRKAQVKLDEMIEAEAQRRQGVPGQARVAQSQHAKLRALRG
eukprot:scaffold7377_cov257-Pinguiococcus_pyrenoidosus.AAC.4